MITPRSRKNKGKKLQNDVRQKILDAFPQIKPEWIKSTMMSEAGVDIQLTPEAREIFPFSVECKNTESLSIWRAIEQSERLAYDRTSPVVVFKKNYSKTYITLELDTFLEICSKNTTK